MNAKRKRLAPILILNLLVVSCISPATVTRSGAGARNPYKQADPSSLSDYIRKVQTLSQTNTAEGERQRLLFLDSRPDLRQLAEQIARTPQDYANGKRLAAAYVEQDLPAAAYPLYQQALTADPNDAEALLGFARIWKRWDDTSAALNYAHASVLLHATPEAFDVLGRIYLARHNPAQAIDAFRLGLGIEPRNAVLLANTGYSLLLESDFPQAMEYLQSALAVDGTMVEARNNLGVVFAKLGEDDAALRELLKNNSLPAGLNNLGVALMETRSREAIHAFERSIQSDPTYLKPRINLAAMRPYVAPESVVDLSPAAFESPARTPLQAITPVALSQDLHVALPAGSAGVATEIARRADQVTVARPVESLPVHTEYLRLPADLSPLKTLIAPLRPAQRAIVPPVQAQKNRDASIPGGVMWSLLGSLALSGSVVLMAKRRTAPQGEIRRRKRLIFAAGPANRRAA